MTALSLFCVGSLKEPYLRDAADEYLKRLTPFARTTVREFREEPGDRRLLAALRAEKGKKIALCVEGVSMSSPLLASSLASWEVEGEGRVIFVIGGSDGLCEEVKAACSFRLSFSELTFPHQLMRVILLEQIYRAYMINAGKTYHK